MALVNPKTPQPSAPSNQGELQNLSRRIKMLEERYTTLRSKTGLTEQNMISKHKTIFLELKSVNLELMELKKDITEVKDKLITVIKELERFASKEKVDVLKKYIDLWTPVKFVTRKEVEDVVRDIVAQTRRE